MLLGKAKHAVNAGAVARVLTQKNSISDSPEGAFCLARPHRYPPLKGLVIPSVGCLDAELNRRPEQRFEALTRPRAEAPGLEPGGSQFESGAGYQLCRRGAIGRRTGFKPQLL